MKTQINQKIEEVVSTTAFVTEADQVLADLNASASEIAYHELAEIPVQRVHPLELFQKNMAQLEELSARLEFMQKEIRYLLKV